MKALLILSLFLSTTCFAQSLDVVALKKLLNQKKTILEQINVGMSKKLTTLSKIQTDVGDCEFTQVSVQTVLRLEGSRIIVHSKDNFIPANSPSCKEAGYETYEEAIVFFEEAPSLETDLADLDASAKDIKSIMKTGELVTLNLNVSETPLTIKYDLSKSSFKNTVSTVSKDFSMTSLDLGNMDVNTIDLSRVLFCENNDGDYSDCVEGDFSDILF